MWGRECGLHPRSRAIKPPQSCATGSPRRVRSPSQEAPLSHGPRNGHASRGRQAGQPVVSPAPMQLTLQWELTLARQLTPSLRGHGTPLQGDSGEALQRRQRWGPGGQAPPGQEEGTVTAKRKYVQNPPGPLQPLSPVITTKTPDKTKSNSPRTLTVDKAY